MSETPLRDRLRRDAVLLVVGELDLAPAVGLVDRPLHRVGHLVGVQDHLGVDVAGGPADRLDQRRLAAQEALLVGVEDRHQRHLRQVEPLAQQVDADQHVERRPGAARAATSMRSMRVELGVQVAACARPPRGGSPSGPRPSASSASSRARARRFARGRLISSIRSSTWPRGRPHVHLRVDQPRRADDLLDHVAVDWLQLVTARAWPTRTAPGSARSLELVELQRPVVERRRQPEAVLDERLLARRGRRRTCRRSAAAVTCDSSMMIRKSSGK